MAIRRKFTIKMGFGLSYDYDSYEATPTYEETKEFNTLSEAKSYLEGVGDSKGWEHLDVGDIEPSIIECGICGSPKIFNITHAKGNHRNIICFGWKREPKEVCHGHYWKGKWYTSQEWDKWLEEVDK